MFFIGDTVKVAALDHFRWATSGKAGKTGRIKKIDIGDSSIKVIYDDGDFEGDYDWFMPNEIIPFRQSFTSVGEAVDFLISNGYRVTLEKLQ